MPLRLHANPSPPEPSLARLRRAHLVGIGGAGMRALAEYLLAEGWRLSGSDLDPSPAEHLAAAGVDCCQGHRAECITDDLDVVVFSPAVEADNVELRRARSLGVPLRSYPQMLAEIMRGRRGIAIAGTHGKSTVTAMAGDLLEAAGRSPGVLLGATRNDGRPAGRPGRGAYLLVEACEYRRHFLTLEPEVGVILNVEPDHFDYFVSDTDLDRAFAEFAGRLPRDGLLLYAGNFPRAERAARYAYCRTVNFGLSPDAEWRATGLQHRRGCYEFDVLRHGERWGRMGLTIAGRHQVLNALAAVALAGELGVDAATAATALANFRGLRRRFECLGHFGGVTVIDDYAHHPSEVAATLWATREAYPNRNVWCVFQPHQASRLRGLLDGFAQSLQNADEVIVTDTFRAREPRGEDGVRGADLAGEVSRQGGSAIHLATDGETLDHLVTHLAPGDVLLTLGAGDVRKVAYGFIDRLRRHRAAS